MTPAMLHHLRAETEHEPLALQQFIRDVNAAFIYFLLSVAKMPLPFRGRQRYFYFYANACIITINRKF
jgi:hypothetical protein